MDQDRAGEQDEPLESLLAIRIEVGTFSSETHIREVRFAAASVHRVESAACALSAKSGHHSITAEPRLALFNYYASNTSGI